MGSRQRLTDKLDRDPDDLVEIYPLGDPRWGEPPERHWGSTPECSSDALVKMGEGGEEDESRYSPRCDSAELRYARRTDVWVCV